MAMSSILHLKDSKMKVNLRSFDVIGENVFALTLNSVRDYRTTGEIEIFLTEDQVFELIHSLSDEYLKFLRESR